LKDIAQRLGLGLAVWAACFAVAHADPTAEIRGDMPAELRDQLVQAVGDRDGPPSNRFEARRRARSAAEDATALLRSEGYYQATVEDDVEGDETPVAVIVVVPGPRFTLATPTVTWTDEVPSPEVDAAARTSIDLKVGDPGRAIDVIGAEGRIVAALSRRGHADAQATPRRVVVDHATLTVEPEYRIDAGPLVRLDGVRLETRGRTSTAWVDYLRPWRDGDVYDPEQVAELERRLLETGVYDGVGVALAPAGQIDAQGNRPVVVTLTDRPRRILEAGATISTGDGAGVDFVWTHYNRFGRADTLRYQARIANIDSRIGADLSLPHWRRPGRTLTLTGALVNEDTDAYVRTALTASADLRQRIGRTSYFTYGVGLDAGQYKESRFDPMTLAPVTFDRDLIILTGRGSAYTDASNDPLDPTRGWRLFVAAQPTAVAGEDTVVFLRAEAQISAYLPLRDDARTVLAGRVRLGSIVGGDELTVPSDRLFYSGGGGSVRGYSYQGVGPRLPDNTPRGGLSLFEASIEARHKLRGPLGVAVFVDAGSVGFQEYPDFEDVRVGAGIGVRYDLPFGPIRADVAFPLNKRDGDADFQIYVSIGQAF
jgi:translocation and assembly module TamA